MIKHSGCRYNYYSKHGLYHAVGGDYVRTTQDLTFSQGEQLKTVDVTIINDNVFENLENFSARITTFDRRVIITEPNAVVQVVDDDIGMTYIHVSMIVTQFHFSNFSSNRG